MSRISWKCFQGEVVHAPFYPPSWNMEVMVGTQAAILEHETGIMGKSGRIKEMEERGPP